MGFKEEFLKMPPGPQRDNFIYQVAIGQGKPKTVPVTVDAPNGKKITYQAMPDMIMIDGIRLPISAQIGQKIANFYSMHLPSPQMINQIYQQADSKPFVTPLSSSGLHFGDKYYTPEEVVKNHLSSPESIIAYNEAINKAIGNKKPNLVGGAMKELTSAPEGSGTRMGMWGWFNNGKPIQGSTDNFSGLSKHDTLETEYATGTRLIGDDVVITDKNGNQETKKLKDVIADPELGKVLSNTNKIYQYNIPNQSNNNPSSSTKPTASPSSTINNNKPLPTSNNKYTSISPPITPQSGKINFMNRIDNFLNGLK